MTDPRRSCRRLLFTCLESSQGVERVGGGSKRVDPPFASQGPKNLHERAGGRARSGLEVLECSDRHVRQLRELELGQTRRGAKGADAVPQFAFQLLAAHATTEPVETIEVSVVPPSEA